MASGLKGKPVSGGGREACPAGNHPGVCVAVIDLGTHWNSFKGQPEKKVRQILFVWEIDVGDEGEERRQVIGRDYGVSYSKDGGLIYGDKSNVRKMLEGWRGKPYGPDEEVDPLAVLGLPCCVNVSNETRGDRVYDSVGGVAKLTKGLKPIKPSHEKVLYLADSDDVVPNMDWLPRVYGETVETIVQRSLEHGGTGRKAAKANGGGAGGGHQAEAAAEPQREDEVPF